MLNFVKSEDILIIVSMIIYTVYQFYYYYSGKPDAYIKSYVKDIKEKSFLNLQLKSGLVLVGLEFIIIISKVLFFETLQISYYYMIVLIVFAIGNSIRGKLIKSKNS